MYHAASNGHEPMRQSTAHNRKPYIKANLADQHRKTPFIIAAQKGRLECLKALFGKVKTRTKDDQGRSALHWAAVNGHTECVYFICAKVV